MKVKLTKKGIEEITVAIVRDINGNNIELFETNYDAELEARESKDGWYVEGFMLLMTDEQFKRRFIKVGE